MLTVNAKDAALRDGRARNCFSVFANTLRLDVVQQVCTKRVEKCHRLLDEDDLNLSAGFEIFINNFEVDRHTGYTLDIAPDLMFHPPLA
jgi:hypothetical protein